MISTVAVCVLLITQLVHAESHVDSPFDPFAASSRCPVPCNSELTQWSQLSSIGELSSCTSTLLFRCNLYNKAPEVPVQACVPLSTPVEAPSALRRSLRLHHFFLPFSKNKRASDNAEQKSKNVQLFRWASDGRTLSLEDMAAAASALAEQLKVRPKDGGDSVLFAKRGSIIMGVFAGAELQKESVSEIVDRFAKWSVGQDGEAAQIAAQICDEDSFSSQILGIFMDTQGNLASVQSKLRDWAQAKCVESKDALFETWREVSVSVVSGQDIIEGTSDGNSSSYSSNISNSSSSSNSSPGPAGTCKTTDAKPGDGCWSLAQRCGISVDDFKKHNVDGICNSLAVGQHVCCSAGALPDFSPQPNPDGSCKTYTIQAGDVCDTIARRNDMTVDQINARNNKVWGWTGCSYLIPGSRICLSEGEPPMPAPIPNAVCGPQVPGTRRPASMDRLAGLNPCPIRACCNVWGQCGITRDFCVFAPADTGAPGTSKPGANGCIYNCGMDIVNNDTPPKSFIRVGYFEAWNLNRPCLHMRANQIDTNRYTHIHFAFGNITNDYKADVSGAQDQFDKFKALRNVKRILSFGGWSFSTDADTAPIFRKGVTDAQRQAFATNVVSFIKDHGLDGVDFDWEYPGAPDIPGIPPGDLRDGERYLQFLKLVREQLPKDKLLGIAAPASYWYLKGFPIFEISEVVDYIIYMTYDMHGQWDYGNRWATPGCDEGNCLRSHVNTTETESALVMITKAGVQANKVIIGMPLYGRSFKMVQKGCWGPDCHFIGPESRARPGRCTGTRGYISNFELREIMATAGDAEVHPTKDGDILVYDKTEWVAWMSPGMYQTRTDWVRGLNFGGTSDWAMDLDASHDDGDGPGGGDGGDGYLVVSPDLWKQDEPVISCYPPCTAVLPPLMLDKPTTISMKPETVTFEENWSTTITVSGQLVTTSAVSITTTVVTVPPVTTTEIHLWGVIWRNDKDDNVFNLTSSVVFPPVTLTKTHTDDDDRRPPITWTYSPRPQPTPDNDDDDGPKPPPPPPPPPPPHPPKVTMKVGPPKPKCKPGQKCGKPCRSNCDPRKTKCVGICGCIGPFCGNGDCVGPFCRPGNCVGVGCIGGGGGGGGGGDGPEECRKRSYVSDCSVPCAVKKLPSTTTTTCRKETCSNTRYGCSITGTTTTSTTTASCGPPVSFRPYNPNDLVASVGDGGEGGIVLETGNYTPPTKPTKTTTTTTTKPDLGPTNPPWPTLTPGIGRGPYCFRENNANNRYSEFDTRSAASVMWSLCSNKDLASGNDVGYASLHEASGLMGYVHWARNQSGCAAKDVVKMGRLCLDALQYIGLSCGDFNDPDHSYGGAYVEQRRYGCVEWYLGIDKARKLMEADGAVNTTDPNSKAVPTFTAVWGDGGTPLETGESRIDLFKKQD